jgi:hypothetical protein
MASSSPLPQQNPSIQASTSCEEIENKIQKRKIKEDENRRKATGRTNLAGEKKKPKPSKPARALAISNSIQPSRVHCPCTHDHLQPSSQICKQKLQLLKLCKEPELCNSQRTACVPSTRASNLPIVDHLYSTMLLQHCRGHLTTLQIRSCCKRKKRNAKEEKLKHRHRSERKKSGKRKRKLKEAAKIQNRKEKSSCPDFSKTKPWPHRENPIC